jgi:hypothetical protein
VIVRGQPDQQPMNKILVVCVITKSPSQQHIP